MPLLKGSQGACHLPGIHTWQILDNYCRQSGHAIVSHAVYQVHLVHQEEQDCLGAHCKAKRRAEW